MDKLKDKLRIGIFGHYGNTNLGDESIIEAVIQNIKKRVPNAKISGFSIHPEDTSIRYNIEAFPIRWNRKKKRDKEVYLREKSNNLTDMSKSEQNKGCGRSFKIKEKMKRIRIITIGFNITRTIVVSLITFIQELVFLIWAYRILRNHDVLMITGSNQFLDNFGGPWAFPYTLFKWSLLAKLAGVKVYYISVGAGPISHRLSMRLIKWALCFSDYTSLRDKGSKKLIEQIGYKGEAHVYPDIAHSLNIDRIQPRRLPFVAKTNNKPTIGINPMPLYHNRFWCEHDEKKYDAYVNKLAQFANQLLREEYSIFFFGTQKRDNDVIHDILSLLDSEILKDRIPEKMVLCSQTVDELMEVFAAADIVVATRFHGTVLSFLSEKPLLGICYYRKAYELMKEMGQEAYSVESENFEVEDLWRRFKALEENLDREIGKIRKRNLDYSNYLAHQYDRLFGASTC